MMKIDGKGSSMHLFMVDFIDLQELFLLTQMVSTMLYAFFKD